MLNEMDTIESTRIEEEIEKAWQLYKAAMKKRPAWLRKILGSRR